MKDLRLLFSGLLVLTVSGILCFVAGTVQNVGLIAFSSILATTSMMGGCVLVVLYFVTD